MSVLICFIDNKVKHVEFSKIGVKIHMYVSPGFKLKKKVENSGFWLK